VKLNDIDLNKLHVFRTVAESASMREAGERLLRTPSAVSQSVGSLERALGLKLFLRAGIRLELTDPGRRLLRQVRASEEGLQSTLDELRREPARVSGRVELGMPPGYPASALASGLSAALLRHPRLQLRLRFLPHAELAAELVRNRLQIALSLQPLRRWERRIQSVKLREERLILAMPASQKPRGSKLEALSVVDYYQNPLFIEGWLKHHSQKKVETQIRVYAANLEHVLELVRKGVGCAVVPRHAVEADLKAGTLTELGLDRRDPWVVNVWLNTLHAEAELSLGVRSVLAAMR
jgi:DNA-binding transcriptional LysR family regulator